MDQQNEQLMDDSQNVCTSVPYNCYYSPRKMLRKFAYKREINIDQILYIYLTNSNSLVAIESEYDLNYICHKIQTKTIVFQGRVLKQKEKQNLVEILKTDRKLYFGC